MRAVLAIALLLSACGDAVRERAEPGFRPFDPAGLDVACSFTAVDAPEASPVFVTLADDELNGARVNYTGEMLELGSRYGLDPDGPAQIVTYQIQEYGNYSVMLDVRPVVGEPRRFEGKVTLVDTEFVSEFITGSCGNG